ncbi:GNAT family N-acetyltransferase [Saccharothrix syringae]|uniref:GNAT family N-acetyltransferase n=1 Tax=Saccharothrix syringae TaxID=103733 RepID=UPI00147754B6|nr:GNAT family N-acetyltransferase [Saccharothrix syringae]
MNLGTMYDTPRPVGGPDRRAVLEVLTGAFMADPVVSWLFPDEDERRRLQPRFYESLLAHPAAEAYLVGGQDGASVWLSPAAGEPPHGEPGEDPREVFGGNAARLLTLGRLLAHRHPRDEAHLYLACMGVAPARQGSGIGSALLRDRLDRAEGLGVYLEAGSPRSRALYARHGFTDLGEPVDLPGGPRLWPMWRAPLTPNPTEQENTR